MSATIDVTGHTFNRLTGLYKSSKRSTNGGVMWMFKCICGKESLHELNRVTRGIIKSCGCSRRKNAELSGLKTEFTNYKYNARQRKLKFKLTFQQFKTIVSDNCRYCGASPHSRTRKGYNFKGNGIDRLDSNDGYILHNIVPCCGICNRAKHTMSYEEFIDYLNRIVEYRT